MISNNAIHAFYFSAKYSCFSRAADILDTTQPNISGQIIKLEKILNTKLFIRKQGRVLLSREGDKLYAIAEKIVNNYKELSNTIEYFFEEDPIVIATQPRLYLNYVAPYLTEKLLADDLIHIKTGELTAIKCWIEKEEVDIIITEGMFDNQSLYKNICIIDILYFSWSKRVDHHFNIPYPTIVHSRAWDHWHDLSSAINDNKDYKRKVIIDTPDFSERLIENGIGIGLLPNSMIEQNPNLEVCRGPTKNNVPGPICLYAKKYSQNKKLNLMVNLFENNLNSNV